MKWSPEQDLHLRALWREGHSCSAIAAEMRCGFSRNAVIGRAYRLGLTQSDPRRKVNPITKARTVKRDARRRMIVANLFRAKERTSERARPTAKVVPPAVDEDEIGGRIEPLPDWVGVELLALKPHHCRWPTWSHGERSGKFCGADRVEPLPYCVSHCRVAYNSAAPRWRPPPRNYDAPKGV